MLYNLIYVDCGNYTEIPPVIYTFELNDEEYETINDLVQEFESMRQPYFYPQMYLIKVVEETNKDEGVFFITDKENALIKWQERQKKREEELEKRREERLRKLEEKKEK